MNPTIANLLSDHRQEIAQLCVKFGVRELRLFGSALGEHFQPTRSDFDFVADFDRPDAPGIADRYLHLAHGLETLFDRPVDLLTRRSIRNPVFRRVVQETSQVIYAA